jgi:hypothetical protein
MNLRDAIAIETLKILMSSTEAEQGTHNMDGSEEEAEECADFYDNMARGAYLMADAMIRVREEAK